MRVLVLGASGMLGNAMFRVLSEDSGCEVFGTIRGAEARRHFCDAAVPRLITGVEVENHDSLVRAFAAAKERSTAPANLVAAARSWVKACSTLTWVKLSLA